ncbi:MAG: multifunctional CCA addition/repair protein [Xanthomonadaceae bacterium]|nr:multifunctional CCA addition/repair protein [Xanthomonadaceae bacterium]
MKTYLVGGAVRDRLLGLTVKDRDYVVVGATPDDLLHAGFKPVGREFPVFLHPQTGEEYALARTERKTGRGYHGFAFDTDPSVTLEDDLRRRDLTINAIAQDENGTLIDPFAGAADLRNGVLRHVSPAFAEDPVRILRVARFAARYASRGFAIAARTIELMRVMVRDGEADHLVPERVWAETRKALAERTPSAFLHALRECGALARIMPEVDALYGVPQRADFHPEIDTGAHVEMVLDAAAHIAPGDALIGWCALTHDLGKALTPAAELPSHPRHEQRGLTPLRALGARLKVPTEYTALAECVCRLHLLAHTAFELRPKTVLELFEKLDAFRQPRRLPQFLLACAADKRGRKGMADSDYPQARYLTELFHAAIEPKAQALLDAGLRGPELGKALREARRKAIAAAIRAHKKNPAV